MTPGSLLAQNSVRYPKKPAFSFIQNQIRVTKTWRAYKESVQHMMFALYENGVRLGDKVAIITYPRYEASIAQMAVMCLGAVLVPIHPRSSEEECEYIINHAEISCLFLEDGIQLKKINKLHKNLKALKHLVLFSRDNYITHFGTFDDFHSSIIHFVDLLALGEGLSSDVEESEASFNKFISAIDKNDACCILYTPGTTGISKAVVVTQEKALQNLELISKAFVLSLSEMIVPLLPIAELNGFLEFMLALKMAWQVNFVARVKQNQKAFRELRPTILFLNPKAVEALYKEVKELIRLSSPFRRKIIYCAIKFAFKVKRKTYGGYAIKGIINRFLYYFVKSLLLFDLVKYFGGRLKFIVSTGGLLNAELMELFAAFGIPIVNAYSLAEAFSFISAGHGGKFDFNPTAFLLDGIECKIVDGEIYLRGNGISFTYFKDLEKTEHSFDDGWFKTGDVGHLKKDRLFVIGRKAEVLTLANGQQVYPERIEKQFTVDVYFEKVLVFGHKQAHLNALLTLNSEAVMAYARSQGAYFFDYKSLIQSKLLIDFVKNKIALINAKLSPEERIKDFVILDRSFLRSKGELTASGKLKRQLCQKKFATLVDTLYKA